MKENSVAIVGLWQAQDIGIIVIVFKLMDLCHMFILLKFYVMILCICNVSMLGEMLCIYFSSLTIG